MAAESCREGLLREDTELGTELTAEREDSTVPILPAEVARGRRQDLRFSHGLFQATAGVLVVALLGCGWLYVPRFLGKRTAEVRGGMAAAELKVERQEAAAHRGMLTLDEVEVNPCFTKKRAYNPIDMFGAIPLVAAVPEECQDRCRDKQGCAFFSFDHISKICHLAAATATLGPLPVAFISGPAVCPSTTLPVTNTSTSSTSTMTETSTATETVTTVTETVTETTLATTKAPTTTKPKLPSLYCFEMAMPTGYEPGLVRAQAERGASIFGCEAHDVFSTEVWEYGEGQMTTKVHARESQKGSWGSWLNTANFLAIWDNVLTEGRYQGLDWTAKADPDAVFFPDRLQLHLNAVLPQGSKGEALYLKNCPKSFGLMGVLEVFSRKAVEAFGDNRGECEKKYNPKSSGEDGYMHACMVGSGVRGVEDFQLLIDNYCGMGSCDNNHWNVAFHPYKNKEGWLDCWRKVVKAR